MIDKEISEIVEAQYQRAIALLEEHKDKLTELANELLEKEVIFKESLERIFGPRPFATPELAEPKKEKSQKDESSDKAQDTAAEEIQDTAAEEE